jgi:hypothetical protein
VVIDGTIAGIFTSLYGWEFVDVFLDFSLLYFFEFVDFFYFSGFFWILGFLGRGGDTVISSHKHFGHCHIKEVS